MWSKQSEQFKMTVGSSTSQFPLALVCDSTQLQAGHRMTLKSKMGIIEYLKRGCAWKYLSKSKFNSNCANKRLSKNKFIYYYAFQDYSSLKRQLRNGLDQGFRIYDLPWGKSWDAELKLGIHFKKMQKWLYLSNYFAGTHPRLNMAARSNPLRPHRAQFRATSACCS